MTTTQRLTPGTDAYWRDRRLAFAAIAELERAIERCKHAPLYFAGSNYPDDEDDVIENTEPFERAHELRQLAQANPTVVEILRAQGRNGLLIG